jgi:hypothetical protein
VVRLIMLRGLSNWNQAINTTDVDEEAIHYIDSHLGFSERTDWIEAVDADKEKAKGMLSAIAKVRRKEHIFDGVNYEAQALPAEFLVDMHIFLNALPEEDASVKATLVKGLFPNTYPLYETFIAEMKQAADHVREKHVASPDPTRKTDHAATVLAARDGPEILKAKWRSGIDI